MFWLVTFRQWRRKELLKVQARRVWVVSSRVDSRTIYLKLLLISFDHANGCLHTIKIKSFFFFFWHYQACLQLHPMEVECLCEYVAMLRPITSCHIVARKCVFTRINLLKHLSAVAVENGIVSRIFNIYIFGYKVLFTGSKDGMVLPDLWDIIHMFYLICGI